MREMQQVLSICSSEKVLVYCCLQSGSAKSSNIHVTQLLRIRNNKFSKSDPEATWSPFPQQYYSGHTLEKCKSKLNPQCFNFVLHCNIQLSDIERNVCCINQFHVIFINALSGQNISCFSVELMKVNEIASLEKDAYFKCVIWKMGEKQLSTSLSKLIKHSNRFQKIYIFVQMY